MTAADLTLLSPELETRNAARNAEAEADTEYDDYQQRRREAELLAGQLGYPRMSEVGVYGGGALWGYAITGANPERLTQLEAALLSWRAGNRSWDVPAIICPVCQEQGYIRHAQCPRCKGVGRLARDWK